MFYCFTDPCESVHCGPNSHCMLINMEAHCLCSNGFTGVPGITGGCTDLDECVANPCPPGAICNNLPGSYSCECAGGIKGDPYREGCAKSELILTCDVNSPCPAGEQCINDNGNNVCICLQGYIRNQDTGKCRDVNECMELKNKPACGINSVCKNLPGSYECKCPPGFNGNPYSFCEECNSIECQCQPPYKLVDGNCVLSGCSKGEKCPPGAECIQISGGVNYCACPKGYHSLADGSCQGKAQILNILLLCKLQAVKTVIYFLHFLPLTNHFVLIADVNECTSGQQVCGYGAECLNKAGTFECHCPPGYSGDAYNGLCAPAQKKCASDGDCTSNEKCVQPGECVCPPPFFLDASDGQRCKSPCERFPCGINAKCTPSDPPKCVCASGFEGDPLLGCVDHDECSEAPCAYGARCINQKGGYQCICPNGMTGDPYKSGCK